MATTKTSSGSLRSYLITRLLLVIPMVWILVTLVFFVLRVVGNPIKSAFGQLPPEEIARREHAAGLDRPLITQYWSYLKNVAHLDFGVALTDHTPISEILRVNGAATLELTFWAVVFALAVGVPPRRVSARHRDLFPDVGLRLFGVLAYAIPVFFLGLLLKLLFSVQLGWLPVNGRAAPNVESAINDVAPNTHIYLINAILYGDNSYIWDVLKHAVMPAVTLGLLTGGVFLRLVRVNLLQTLRADYVESARARGVPEKKVVRKHAFKTALIPVVTVMGLHIAALIGGSGLTEETFEWQGLGYKLAFYLQRQDYVAVQGIVTAVAVAVAIISFLIDVVAATVYPRVRY